MKSYYKNGQLKLSSKGDDDSGGRKEYYENGQLRIRQMPRIKRIYNLDKQLVGKIKIRKRVSASFELETFLTTYTAHYNWKWTAFDSLRRKKWIILYRPSCGSPGCPFPDSLLASNLDRDTYYEVLIFEEGKLCKKIKAGKEIITLYEKKERDWIEIKRLPIEAIYRLMESFGED